MKNEMKQTNLLMISLVIVVLSIVGVLYLFLGRDETTLQNPANYSEVFENPIDLRTEKALHRDVYSTIKSTVGFTVLMPSAVPESYNLSEVKSFGPTGGDDAGSFETTYISGQKTFSFGASRGKPPISASGEQKKVNLKGGTTAYLITQEDGVTNLIWFEGQTAGYIYYVTSKDLPLTKLISIAHSLDESL
jgi:hypothetical protein